jgi:hypothetical protein
MSILAASGTEELTGAAHRRAIAISNINWFRATAWKALRDGGPKAELRAVNARTAARIVLKQARRDALVTRITTNAMFGAESLAPLVRSTVSP